MAKRGRPSSYNKKLAAKICGHITECRSLRWIAKQDGMPSVKTMMRWLASNEEFRQQYAHAKEIQAETFADEILEIADDGVNDTYRDEQGRVRTDHDVIARSRLRVDTRKWLMSKMLPKKYGKQQRLEHTGADGKPLAVVVMPEEIESVEAWEKAHGNGDK